MRRASGEWGSKPEVQFETSKAAWLAASAGEAAGGAEAPALPEHATSAAAELSGTGA